MYLEEDKILMVPMCGYSIICKTINEKRISSFLINGAGDYSRDFTYVDNVVQMNERAMLTTNPKEVKVYKYSSRR